MCMLKAKLHSYADRATEDYNEINTLVSLSGDYVFPRKGTVDQEYARNSIRHGIEGVEEPQLIGILQSSRRPP